MVTKRVDPRPLHREQIKTLKHRKLIAWDIETKGAKVGDALYGSICENGICLLDGEEPYFFSTLDSFLECCIEKYEGYYLAAHNGKGYEFNYLKDTLCNFIDIHKNYEIFCMHQGDAIIGYQLIQHTSDIITRGKNKGKKREDTHIWYFVDTLPIFNMKLSEVAKAFCPEFPKGELNWKKEDWNYNNESHRMYLIRDCRIIQTAFYKLENLCFTLFSTKPGLTAGSTAIKAFKASIPEGYVYYRNNRHVEEFCRRAYRGGLVIPGTTTKEQHDIAMLDVKAAYGYQMKTNLFPVGNPCMTFQYEPKKQGVYHVHVKTPDNLPFGIIAYEGTSTYPLGEFDTVITHVELEYALTLGYEFEVYQGYFWERVEPVFKPFIESCEELETTQVDGKYVFKDFAKLLRNSLYGKFCTKIEAERYCLLPKSQQLPDNAGLIIDSKTGELIPGIYYVTEEVNDSYIMPIWGALITAYQRVYLAKRAYKLYELGADSVYGDTDSLAASQQSVIKLQNIGMLQQTGKYGSWEREGIADTLLVAAPKVYIMTDKHGNVLKARAKGLPLNQLIEKDEYCNILTLETFLDNIANNREEYHFTTSNSIKTRLKHPELPIKLERKRRMTLLANSPNWDYNAKTERITPKHIAELPLDRHREPVVYTEIEIVA